MLGVCGAAESGVMDRVLPSSLCESRLYVNPYIVYVYIRLYVSPYLQLENQVSVNPAANEQRIYVKTRIQLPACAAGTCFKPGSGGYLLTGLSPSARRQTRGVELWDDAERRRAVEV